MARAQQMRPVPNAQVYQDNNGNYYLIENDNRNPVTMTNTGRSHNGGRYNERNIKRGQTTQRTKNVTRSEQTERRPRDRPRRGFASRHNGEMRRERPVETTEEGEQRNFSQCMLTCRLYIARNRSGGSFVDSRVHSCVRYGEEDILSHHTKINNDYRGGESNYSLYVYPLFFEATREGQDMFSDFQETINRFRAGNEDKRPQSLATGKKYFLPFPSVRAQQNIQHNGRYVVSLLLNTELLNNTENPCTEDDLMTRLSNELTPLGMTIENHYVRYNDNFPRREETREEVSEETNAPIDNPEESNAPVETESSE